jgi:hypothetical protein
VDEDEVAAAAALPSQRRLCSARSMHAQTHKLKRQVTICEDSVSIAESVRSGSVRKRLDSARRVSASPSPVPLQRVSSPPPVVVEEDVFLEEGQTHAQRMALLPRQESSFTQEEIHR